MDFSISCGVEACPRTKYVLSGFSHNYKISTNGLLDFNCLPLVDDENQFDKSLMRQTTALSFVANHDIFAGLQQFNNGSRVDPRPIPDRQRERFRRPGGNSYANFIKGDDIYRWMLTPGVKFEATPRQVIDIPN